MSATPTLDLFKLLIPEFCDGCEFPDSLVNTLLTFSATKLDCRAFDCHFQEAVIYYTAHLLKKRKQASLSSGAFNKVLGGISPERIKKIKEDILEIELHPISDGGDVSGARNGDIDLLSTVYGRQFIALRDSVVISPMLIDGC